VPRDEAARNDEKDVDPNVAAPKVGWPHMEGQDQEDRGGAQGLDVGPEGHYSGRVLL